MSRNSTLVAGPVARISQDAFLGGKFEVLQPADGRHRSGMDALLLSACVPFDFVGKLADFGAGAGVAGMAIAIRNFAVEIDLVEKDSVMAALAKRSQKLPVNRKLYSRIRVVNADVTLTGKERLESGIANNVYNFVIMNPPFNNPSHRPSPVIQRQEAHIMGEGGLDSWLRTAAASLQNTGKVALVFRPSGLGQVLAGFQGRFGSTRIIPVHPKPDSAANRILVVATKGDRGEVSILPGFTVHNDDGSFTDIAAKVFSGDAVLPQLQN